MKADGRILLSNSVWSLLNQLGRVGSLAIVTIALSRHFGPARFGALAYGLAFVRIFAVIADVGLDRILVRQFVEVGESSRALLGHALRLKLVFAVLSYAALLVLVRTIDPAERLTFAIVVLAGAGLIFQACDVYDYFFQAENRFHLVFLGRTLPILLATAIKLAAIALGAPLLVFALLETVGMALIAAALLCVFRSLRASPVGGKVRALSTRKLLREGFPLLLGSLAAMIYMRSDVLMLGKMAGFRAAGLYSAASQITEACALFPMAFLPALFPILLRWRERGPAFYRQQFERLFMGAALAGLAVATGVTLLAPLIVRILYGPAFNATAGILAVHVWSAIFLFVAILQTGYDITERLTWFTAMRTAGGSIVNIVLNYLLIPRYGASGSAVATIFSLSCSGFLFNLLHPATRPIFWMQLRGFLLLPLVRPSQSLSPIQLSNPGSVAR